MSGPDRTPTGPSVDGDPAEGPSVFGSLPRTRPAVRSPRRAEARAESPEPQEPEVEARSREAEVEALARAGVSLAGEVATLGFRIAGRAAATLRDAVERR